MPVLWLTPLWESILTLSSRLVDPIYVPRLHRGQVYLYITSDCIKGGSLSLNLKRDPRVRGFLGISLRSSPGINLVIVSLSAIRNSFVCVNGMLAYIFSFGTVGI